MLILLLLAISPIIESTLKVGIYGSDHCKIHNAIKLELHLGSTYLCLHDNKGHYLSNETARYEIDENTIEIYDDSISAARMSKYNVISTVLVSLKCFRLKKGQSFKNLNFVCFDSDGNYYNHASSKKGGVIENYCCSENIYDVTDGFKPGCRRCSWENNFGMKGVLIEKAGDIMEEIKLNSYKNTSFCNLDNCFFENEVISTNLLSGNIIMEKVAYVRKEVITKKQIVGAVIIAILSLISICCGRTRLTINLSSERNEINYIDTNYRLSTYSFESKRIFRKASYILTFRLILWVISFIIVMSCSNAEDTLCDHHCNFIEQLDDLKDPVLTKLRVYVNFQNSIRKFQMSRNQLVTNERMIMNMASYMCKDNRNSSYLCAAPGLDFHGALVISDSYNDEDIVGDYCIKPKGMNEVCIKHNKSYKSKVMECWLRKDMNTVNDLIAKKPEYDKIVNSMVMKNHLENPRNRSGSLVLKDNELPIVTVNSEAYLGFYLDDSNCFTGRAIQIGDLLMGLGKCNIYSEQVVLKSNTKIGGIVLKKDEELSRFIVENKVKISAKVECKREKISDECEYSLKIDKSNNVTYILSQCSDHHEILYYGKKYQIPCWINKIPIIHNDTINYCSRDMMTFMTNKSFACNCSGLLKFENITKEKMVEIPFSFNSYYIYLLIFKVVLLIEMLWDWLKPNTRVIIYRRDEGPRRIYNEDLLMNPLNLN